MVLERSAPIQEFMIVYVICGTARDPDLVVDSEEQMEGVARAMESLCFLDGVAFQDLPSIVQPRDRLGKKCVDLIHAVCKLTSRNGEDTYRPDRYDAA